MRPITVCCLVGLVVGAQAPPDRISPDTIARLAVTWTYDTRESTEPFRPGGDRPAFEATPVYAAGRLYLSTPGGLVIALDAESGAELWRVDLKIRRDANYSDFANRGVAVTGTRVYGATVDARLVCLERQDGRFCDGFGAQGQVDLIAGLRRKPEWPGEYGVTSPPAIYRDLVIVGSSVADNSRARMSSGEVRAFDAKSGALRWTFHPLAENTQAGGANTWSRIAVDEASGLVFLPTGSASPDYFGGLRQGNNQHANAVVALHGATGVVAWSFQTVHHDRSASSSVRNEERSSGLGGAAPDERARDATPLHDGGRPPNGRHRGRGSRHAVVPTWHDARCLRSEGAVMPF